MVRTLARSLAIAWLITACDGGGGRDAGPSDGGVATDAGGGVDWPRMEVPASTVPVAGVRREIFRVAGFTPPANPNGGATTPSELDFTQVVRFRADQDPPVPVRAILVAMPGLFGGAPSYESLAEALVLRGVNTSLPVEVWAIDRRSNALEDLRGADAAEAAGNPEIAQGYYFGRDTVGGEAFPGFHTASELSYMSEWGLTTHAEDLRRVIAMVPEADRRSHVFLLGHSLGGSFAEAYASWRFEDGTRGVEELAGIVLIDGALGTTALSEDEYRNGTPGIMGLPGVDTIRAASPFIELPLLGVSVYPRAEVMALRARFAPTEVVRDRARDEVLGLLLNLPRRSVPPMTNLAALGWGFDTSSNALTFAAVSCGEPTGGPIETYTSTVFGDAMLTRPSDPSATYDWLDAPDTDPPEPTPMSALIASWVHGRSNFAEWYFPTRLALDLQAVAGPDVPEDDWRADEGLRTFDRQLVDAPVLAIGAALVGADGYADLPTRLAPTVGAGRPHEGATRTEELGLRVVDLSFLSHIDPLSGVDSDRNTTSLEIMRFVDEHAAVDGTVSLPAM
ncbi:MAG: alpha/beta hydrolase [Sandaracinaceae bacterium]